MAKSLHEVHELLGRQAIGRSPFLCHSVFWQYMHWFLSSTNRDKADEPLAEGQLETKMVLICWGEVVHTVDRIITTHPCYHLSLDSPSPLRSLREAEELWMLRSAVNRESHEHIEVWGFGEET